MQTLLSISIALCAGLLISRFVKPLKMPAVTGYLIAGILIGPYCLGRLGVTGVGFTSMDEQTQERAQIVLRTIMTGLTDIQKIYPSLIRIQQKEWRQADAYDESSALRS